MHSLIFLGCFDLSKIPFQECSTGEKGGLRKVYHDPGTSLMEYRHGHSVVADSSPTNSRLRSSAFLLSCECTCPTQMHTSDTFVKLASYGLFGELRMVRLAH